MPRQTKGNMQYWMCNDELPEGSGDLLMMCRYTCPAATSPTLTPQDNHTKNVRVSRAKRRSEERRRANEEHLLAREEELRRLSFSEYSSGSLEGQSLSRSASSGPSCSVSTASSIEDETTPEDLPLKVKKRDDIEISRRRRGCNVMGDFGKADLNALGEDGVRTLQLSLQLFLMDAEMRTMRYCLCDRHQRKTLTKVAKSYKLTAHPMELQYQALLDAQETEAFTLIRNYHKDIATLFPSLDLTDPETMHNRLVRADSYLKQLRDNKHAQARRKERIPLTRDQFYITA